MEVLEVFPLVSDDSWITGSLVFAVSRTFQLLMYSKTECLSLLANYSFVSEGIQASGVEMSSMRMVVLECPNRTVGMHVLARNRSLPQRVHSSLIASAHARSTNMKFQAHEHPSSFISV